MISFLVVFIIFMGLISYILYNNLETKVDRYGEIIYVRKNKPKKNK